MHAVDPDTYQVLPVDKVLETIDSKYDQLKDVYQQFGVETLIAASASSKGNKMIKSIFRTPIPYKKRKNNNNFVNT